jgi:hypothetical protein
MADPQDKDDFSKKFADLSINDKRALKIHEVCQGIQKENPGDGVKAPHIKIEDLRNFSSELQHYWNDYGRLYIKHLDQQFNEVLLQVCSWNPNADGLLTEKDPQKCLYGTLGVMAPDVLCLQETIWKTETFLKNLCKGEKMTDDRWFVFTSDVWKVWGTEGSTEVAILYNSAKFKVDKKTAEKGDKAWRDRVESIRNKTGEDNDWRRFRIKNGDKEERTERLEDRTVALQGKIVSTNRDVIIISIHMFYKGYTAAQRVTLSSEIVSQAQELANVREMPVFLGGDWNCNVFNIRLTTGASMPDPLNHLRRTERGNVDGMIIINPVRVEARAEAGAARAEAGAAARAGTAAGAAAEPGAARAEAELGAARDGAAAGAEAEAAAKPGTAGANGAARAEAAAEAGPARAAAGAAAGVAARAAPEPPKLKLDNVRFFKWTDIVTANDMGGLEPADIDRIYRRRGKHRPIVANVKIEPVVDDNLVANNAN